MSKLICNAAVLVGGTIILVADAVVVRVSFVAASVVYFMRELVPRRALKAGEWAAWLVGTQIAEQQFCQQIRNPLKVSAFSLIYGVIRARAAVSKSVKLLFCPHNTHREIPHFTHTVYFMAHFGCFLMP